MALGNTDDHLRNHGFLADRGSWTISPAFDVNPTPDPWRARSTSIMGADTQPEKAAALLALADGCSLGPAQAREKMRRVAGALSNWRDAARNNGIPTQELTMMTESIQPRLEAVLAVAATGAST